MTASLAFLDTETVTLEPGPDVIWEIGLILRDEHNADTEWRWQIRPNMDRAHPKALEVSRFADRFEVPDGVEALGWPDWNPAFWEPVLVTRDAVAANLCSLLEGRHVVGAVPNFDTERLSLFLRAQGELTGPDPWHYHLIDVENLAVGYLRGRQSVGEDAPLDNCSPPWNSEQISRAVGVGPPGEDARHTALGDARWVRDIYDAVMGGAR